MKLNKIITTVFGTALITLPALSLAQSAVEIIEVQFQKANQFLTDEGYSLTHDPIEGQLGRDAYDNLNVNLMNDFVYAIVAVCDNNCTDINLEIYDENNHLIDSDTETDDIPILQVAPKWTGKFDIKVTMVSCSNVPCSYGLRVYGKPGE